MALGSDAFESQCFISKHKSLHRDTFCPRLHSGVWVSTVREVKEGSVFEYHVPCGPIKFMFVCLLKMSRISFKHFEFAFHKDPMQHIKLH